MKEFLRAYGDLPQPSRWAVLGTVLGGILGGLAGLVIGLIAYPPTAWFAVFEVGIPSTVLGTVVGTIAGLVARRIQSGRRRHARKSSDSPVLPS